MTIHDLDEHRHDEPRRVGLEDVARRAGVSRSTASRALVDDPRISEPTRAAVKAAATLLQYVPNAAARGLRAKRTRILGLLLTDLSDPVHGQIAAAFEQEALAGGYRVIVGAGMQDASLERKVLRVFMEQAVDGVAMVSSVMAPTEARSHLRSDRLIFVLPDHRTFDPDSPPVPGSLLTDDAEGVEAIVDHLVELGHRDISYVGSGELVSSELRLEAVERALARHGLHHVADRYPSPADGWRRPGPIAARIAADLPDALICYDDALALALMDALRSLGVETPDDVAIVGFDGIAFAALSNPRLTTVSTPLSEIGRLAASSLIRTIQTGVLPESRVLPVELIVRESTRSEPPAPVERQSRA